MFGRGWGGVCEILVVLVGRLVVFLGGGRKLGKVM